MMTTAQETEGPSQNESASEDNILQTTASDSNNAISNIPQTVAPSQLLVRRQSSSISPREIINRSPSWLAKKSPRLRSGSNMSPLLNPKLLSSSEVPFIPNLLESSQNPSVDAALKIERIRIKDLEDEEKNYSSDQLKEALKRERLRSLRLVSDLARLKSTSVKSQADAEAHEEALINGLLRRLECLQKEKGRIIVELEREEEMLTNTLQRKLSEVRREKALLEKQIENEKSSNAILKNHLSSS